LIEGKSASKLIDGFNAPLGTFSARIEAAFAMGILDETEYRELNHKKN
jgi:mannitol operon repressor